MAFFYASRTKRKNYCIEKESGMVKAFGVARVISIKSGEKNGRPWAIAKVAWQEYDGKDENGKFKFRDEYASLMLRNTKAERFAKVVKEGQVVQFLGKPRAGEPYTPSNGGKPRSSLEFVIDDYVGEWELVPTSGTMKAKEQPASTEEDEDVEEEEAPRPRKSAPVVEDDDEDPDSSQVDPFANMIPPKK